LKLPLEASSWFNPNLFESGLALNNHPQELERLWRAFMTARAALGLVLVLLQGGIFFLVSTPNSTPLLICGSYFIATLAVRLISHPQQLGYTFDTQWLRTVGIDLLTFAALQTMEQSSINYAPLFALPVLMASVLGTLMIAMGTAAGVTLLLFAYATWQSMLIPWDSTSHFFQAALTGAGCFAISFIASQLATRLASVELRAQRSQLAAVVQRQVNELVVSSLNDGILVTDDQFIVRLANPAACLLLGTAPASDSMPWSLTDRPAWQVLWGLVAKSYSSDAPQQSDVIIRHPGQGARHLQVRTRLTKPLQAQAQVLCVIFMQDQREMQARLRTEKLASLGRMSAAVAHEIRNPLSAIVQANALLSEELHAPDQLRLTHMVAQNAQRLEKIVRDVLHLAHANNQENGEPEHDIDLTQAVERICRDWQRHNDVLAALWVDLPATSYRVWFDAEHLRRVLINLLDNARRFSSGQKDTIQVYLTPVSAAVAPDMVRLSVWSDGEPLEPSVEQHLFEPFFSSDSRSSGLGLYICRELCASHAATMAYDRSQRFVGQQSMSGNEFSVQLRTHPATNLSAS
jgi:two-component system sensor histidine kinase PilS (NtrC family)